MSISALSSNLMSAPLSRLGRYVEVEARISSVTESCWIYIWSMKMILQWHSSLSLSTLQHMSLWSIISLQVGVHISAQAKSEAKPCGLGKMCWGESRAAHCGSNLWVNCDWPASVWKLSHFSFYPVKQGIMLHDHQESDGPHISSSQIWAPIF